MPTQTLQLQALTAEAFKPYGDVIELREDNEILKINYGKTQRHHNLAKVDVGDAEGYPLINLFESENVTLPFRIEVMERHPLGSQAFIPLGENPYVVVVGEAGEFCPDRLQAFLASPKQGVNYHNGTWHHFCLALNASSVFAVVDRGGEGDNCDEVRIAEDHELIIGEAE